eukprot:7898-Rhodomonas_salina.1
MLQSQTESVDPDTRNSIFQRGFSDVGATSLRASQLHKQLRAQAAEARGGGKEGARHGEEGEHAPYALRVSEAAAPSFRAAYACSI